MLLPTAPKFQDLKFTCIKCIIPDPGTAFRRILETIVLILPDLTLSEPGRRKEKTKRKEKGRKTIMTQKRGKIAGQECKNLFNSDGLLFPEKKTLQKVITWLRKLNNKSDLFEPWRAPDPLGYLSK